jgi:hypothetical protein
VIHLLQPVYIRDCAHCNPRICDSPYCNPRTYATVPTAYATVPTTTHVHVHKTCMNTSIRFSPLMISSFYDFLSPRPDLPKLHNFPLLKSPSLLAQVVHSLMLTPSFTMIKCHNDLSPLYTSPMSEFRHPF